MNCLLAEIIDKEEEYKSKKENLKKDYKGLFKKCSEDLNRDNLSLEEIKRIGLKAKKLFNSKKEKLLLSLSIGRRDRDKMKKIIKNRESLLKLIKLSKEKINQPIKSFKEDLKAKKSLLNLLRELVNIDKMLVSIQIGIRKKCSMNIVQLTLNYWKSN